MKIILIILSFTIFSFSSCNPTSDKYVRSKKAIRIYLSKTMDNYSSYQPVDYEFDTSSIYNKGWRVRHTYRETNTQNAVVLTGQFFNLDSAFNVESTEDLSYGDHAPIILPDIK